MMSKISNLIIDSHQHFWRYDPSTYSWIDDSMKSIQKDFLPEDLEPLLTAHGVEGCIAVQADQSEEETKFLLDLAARFTFIKGVVGWVDLNAPKVGNRLKFFSEDPKFKGVRHTVYDNAGEFMLQPDFQRGVASLREFNLTYDILVFDYQLPGAIALAKKFPYQFFVLDHLGKPDISEGISKDWLQNIQKLAQCKNVFCKISGMVSETRDYKWSIDDFELFIEVALRYFGSDRIMYGSDWPVCLCAATYKDTIDIVMKNTEHLEDEFHNKIFRQNAINFYRLDN